ncbi:MAG: copper resistance protein CopC, partial [Chloroflexi bacterium]|nr:copper resistance protein CopC [Chloroflexota bacterium]
MVGSLISVRTLFLGLLIALLGAAGWVTFTGTPTSSAHAVQLASNPAPDEQLLEWPRTISLSFSEPLEPSVGSIQVWDTSPAELPVSAPNYLSDDSVSVDVIDELRPGIYTVIWRNLSTVDGHTWAGSFSFTVLNPDGTVPGGTVPSELLD